MALGNFLLEIRVFRKFLVFFCGWIGNWYFFEETNFTEMGTSKRPLIRDCVTTVKRL